MFAARNMLFAGSSAFNPLSLSPALWLSDTGSDPSVWPDISGNGRHATQATAANQPAIVAGALNGRQVRRFDGINDYFRQTARDILKNVSGSTIFAVHKSISATSNERQIIQLFGATGVTRANLAVDNASNASGWWFGGRRLDSDLGDFNASVSDYSVGSFHIATAQNRYFEAKKELWINGVSDYVDPSFQTAGNTENTDSSLDTFIGSNNALSSFFQGDIAELLVYPTALSTADRQAVENYLNNKWAIY